VALETWVGCPTCDLKVTVGGDAAPPSEEGLTFGVVGDIHIRVCMSNSGGLRDVCCFPHGSL
jgi:hypothetical protein